MHRSLSSAKVSGILAALSLVMVSTGLLVPSVSAKGTGRQDHLPAQITPASPAALHNSTREGPVSARTPWTIGIVLPSKNFSGLMSYANAVSSPGSGRYHQFLSHSALMQRFGPSPALVHTLTTYLKHQGFRVSETGQIIQARGTAALVDRLFSTHLTHYKKGQQNFVAPPGAVLVPSALRIAVGITGLVTDTAVPLGPPPVNPKTARVRWTAESAMKPAPTGQSGTASNGAFQITAQLLSKGARTPGMAVRYLVTPTLNGQPDPNAAFAGLAGPFQGAPSLVMIYPNGSGQFVLDYTASQAQKLSLALTVTSNFNQSSAPTATVQLPAATFKGPNALVTSAKPLFGVNVNLVAPWNPATNNVNRLFGATRLAAAPSRRGPAQLAVFTAGNVTALSAPDVALFAQQFGLAAPHLHIAYTGPNICTQALCGPGAMIGIQAELSLDLQMMETSSPGADISVYQAGSLRSALNQVVMQDTASVFSISYGAGELAEQAFAPGAQQQWDMLAAEANVEGITITIAAGDGGAYEGAQFGYPQPMASYPANSPFVSAVGGTEVAVGTTGQMDASALWGGNVGRELPHQILLSLLAFGNMMGGGGYSLLEPHPFYQDGLVPPNAGRSTPDFSFPASVVTPGYFAYFQQSPTLFGGTSASTPLFAGWVADMGLLMGTRLGNVNLPIYALSRVDRQVVMPVNYGNNGVYSVTQRYNPVTGLGQLNLGALESALSSTMGMAGPPPGAHHHHKPKKPGR